MTGAAWKLSMSEQLRGLSAFLRVKGRDSLVGEIVDIPVNMKDVAVKETINVSFYTKSDINLL